MNLKNQVFRIGFFTLVLLLSQAGVGNAASKGPRVWKLSEIVQDSELVGYELDSPAERELTEYQVREYLDLIENSLTDERVNHLEAHCFSQSDPDRNPLCSSILLFLRQSERKPSRTRTHSSEFRKPLAEILKGELRPLYTANEKEIKDLMGRFKQKKLEEEFTRKVLAQPDCPPASFLLNLGIQFESFFPEEKAKDLAASLYYRAFQCGRDIFSLQASYRLGLLHIWNGHCDQAEQIFSKVPDAPQAPDYRVRIGYWRYYCAKKAGNHSLSDKLRAWLLREYPLRLHTLLAYSGKNLEEDLPYKKRSDPEIHFRSTRDPGLGVYTRMIEALLNQNLKREAAELLESQVDRVQITEVPFQLYWVVLLNRAQDLPAGFRLLASLFRMKQDLISLDTLGLMYPLDYLPTIKEVSPEIDPFLVLSLIRQESAFNPRAKSSAGAHGLMQIQLATARHFAPIELGKLYEPKTNIQLGVRYFRLLRRQFSESTEMALAAYNAGPTKINYWKQRFPVDNPILFLDLLPLRETRDYVTSIGRNYYWYQSLYSTPNDRKLASESFSIWNAHLTVDEKPGEQ